MISVAPYALLLTAALANVTDDFNRHRAVADQNRSTPSPTPVAITRHVAADRMTSAHGYTLIILVTIINISDYAAFTDRRCLICTDHLGLWDADRFFEDGPNDALVARRSCQTSVVSEVLFPVAWQQIFQRKLSDRIHLLVCSITIKIIIGKIPKNSL